MTPYIQKSKYHSTDSLLPAFFIKGPHYLHANITLEIAQKLRPLRFRLEI